MKKVLKYLVIAIVVGIAGLLSYVKLALPNVGDAPDIKVEMTPENIARGEYLANHVTVCIDCHSSRDWSRFAGPPLEGTLGKGGDVFDQKYGFPGSYTSKNITPSGIGTWTDGELFRTITTGVGKDGKALFPVMPFHYYGQMDEEDIKCIIAYIRTLKSIENKPAASVSDFPMSFIINTIPHKANFQKRPTASDVLNTGKYLVNATACKECHTKFDKGQLIAGTEFGGGREFPFPDGSIVRSGNITPDEETGIGSWTKDKFISLFKSRSDSTTLHTKLNKGDFNTIMPWTMYGGMTNEDLEAIYTYLRTVKPIKNSVEKYTAAH
jgi:mono/diheme cytochrome c family protein